MKSQVLNTLKNSRAYTLAVAESMPEKSYSYKPTAEVFNFNELMAHIAYGIEWWRENYIAGIKAEWNPPAMTKGRREAIQSLNEAYDSLESTLDKVSLNDAVVNGFHATLDHITHHHGQAITYFRCQNIVPPDYIY